MGEAPLNRMLPQSLEDQQAYVDIKPFETGLMVTPSATVIENAQGTSMATSWRFLLKHSKTNTSFWFDMGISHDLSVYSPQIQNLHRHFKPTPSKTSTEEDTISCGISPHDIKHVIISHGHWDHLHPLPPTFTNASMIVGPGSISYCAPSYPLLPTSKFDGRIWDASLRSFPLTELLPTSDSIWKPLGPFPHTSDFFSDGSFYLINAPGHMQGNLAALARVKTKTNELKWVLLGGDCAHCNLFTYCPDAPFGRMPEKLFPSGTLHECREEAREMIQRIAECKRNEGVGCLFGMRMGSFWRGRGNCEVLVEVGLDIL